MMSCGAFEGLPIKISKASRSLKHPLSPYRMTSTLIPSTPISSTLSAAPSLSGAPRLNAPTVHRLANGLTIIAERMPVAAVNLDLWLPVGSAVEADPINGMAHFLEHMIFKGTARLHSGEFERRIEARGARTNAATSQDYTHYYITTAPQDFADLAPLQLDVVLNPTIPEAGFERERQVVLEEIRRSQDNARHRVFQHTSQLTFERLPYRRQVLGSASVIKQLTAQQMRDFHRHWYQPAAMTAAVVGDLPVDQLIRIVEESATHAGLPGVGACKPAACNPGASPSLGDAAYPPPALHPPEVPFTHICRCEVTDATLQQARLIMTWRVPGLMEMADTYALDVLASVLAQGRTARLVKDLREQRGLSARGFRRAT